MLIMRGEGQEKHHPGHEEGGASPGERGCYP